MLRRTMPYRNRELSDFVGAVCRIVYVARGASSTETLPYRTQFHRHKLTPT